MPLESTLKVTAVSLLTSALDLATGSVPLNFEKRFALADGSGLNQASKVFHDRRTLGASSTEDLDLSGVLLDAFGAVLTFTAIKGIFVAAEAANPEDVIVGGAATNGFIDWVGGATHTVTVRPGGALALIAPTAAGYLVTAATADLLRIGNGGAGGSVTYDIVLFGA
jgi:hypothetical protein